MKIPWYWTAILLLSVAVLLTTGYIVGSRPKTVPRSVVEAARRGVFVRDTAPRILGFGGHNQCLLTTRGVADDALVLRCHEVYMANMQELGDFFIKRYMGGKEQLQSLQFRALYATVDESEYWMYDVSSGKWLPDKTSGPP